jgi:acetyl-CoA synthetase
MVPNNSPGKLNSMTTRRLHGLDGPKDVLPVESMIHPALENLRELHSRSLQSPENFWQGIARELFWYEQRGPVFTAIDRPPYGSWFEGWSTNISYNCLDRHVNSWRRNKVAYYWENENGEMRVITYQELYDLVNRISSGLRKLGVKKGDRITLYLPMVPELPASMLAVLRIGAIHSVIFAGFTSKAIADRLTDSGSEVVITADFGYRKGRKVPLKQTVDDALEGLPFVKKVIVLKRGDEDMRLKPGRDVLFSELLKMGDRYERPEPLIGNHPSYILYTSGTTGKPKGATHGTGGYMVWVYYTQKVVFDVRDAEVYWCTADIGWVTGHSYIVYGPLLNGLTSVLYEGALDHPDPGRWWEIVEKYRVNVFYTSPTSVRMFMKYGERWPESHDLSSIRILGSVGEPINPEAWKWYRTHIGADKAVVVDTWWQTETGGIMISPQPGNYLVPLKPGSATFPIPGVDADVLDDAGKAVEPGQKGYLVIRRPWPGQFITLWKDEERFRSVYFSKYPGLYYPGDYALKDSDGYFWLLGRADEVLKVAGHRIGTVEIEDSLISHPAVAESAVIGRSDPIKMQVPVAFVVLRPGNTPSDNLRRELLEHVRSTIGPIAIPDNIYFVEKLPKTRSGKIMRRIIGAVVEGRSIGDVTTLEDETSVEEARRAYTELKDAIKG